MRPSYKPPKQTPIEARKIARFYVGASLEDVFEAAALEWHDKQVIEWSAAHICRIKQQIERNLFSWSGSRFIASTCQSELLVAPSFENRPARMALLRGYQSS